LRRTATRSVIEQEGIGLARGPPPQPAGASHRDADTTNLRLVIHGPMFAIIHDTRTYRYLMARYARAAPTAMPRASRAISLATRWRFTYPPPSSWADRTSPEDTPVRSLSSDGHTPLGDLAHYAIRSIFVVPLGSRQTLKRNPVVVIDVRPRSVGRYNGTGGCLERLLAGHQYEDSANFASTQF
jgi:hypothetical protein